MDKIGSDPLRARTPLHPHLGALEARTRDNGDDQYAWRVCRDGQALASGVIRAYDADSAMHDVRDAAVQDDILRPFQVEITKIFFVEDVSVPKLRTTLEDGTEI